jgi:hypothetical protein
LRRVRDLAVGATGVVWLIATVMVYNAQATVADVAARTGPAKTAADVAYACLVDADHTVIHSFLTGAAQLGGPGQRYLDDIKGASQALGQLAEDHAGDAAATGRLQSLGAMLVTYMGLVEQADATHRLAVAGGQQTDLGLTYLWYASKLLHEGMLDQIRALGAVADASLAEQRAAVSLRPAALFAFVLATILLLIGLIGTQVWLTRRYRRMVNPGLAFATLGLLVLSLWTALATVNTSGHYRSALDGALPQLAGTWQAGTLATDADGQAALGVLLSAPCTSAASTCKSTVDAGDTALAKVLTGAAADVAYPPPARLSTVDDLMKGVGAVSQALRTGDSVRARTLALANARPFAALDADLTDQTQAAQREFNDTIAAASDPSGVRVGIPVLAVAIAALTVLGFKPRLDEYRPSVS